MFAKMPKTIVKGEQLAQAEPPKLPAPSEKPEEPEEQPGKPSQAVASPKSPVPATKLYK